MKLPKTNKRDSANAECKKFKHLTDREGEVYFIGLSRGFEQAKKQLLAKIKERKEIWSLKTKDSRRYGKDLLICQVRLDELKWLEGELKVDSASKEADTSNGLEGELK